MPIASALVCRAVDTLLEDHGTAGFVLPVEESENFSLHRYLITSGREVQLVPFPPGARIAYSELAMHMRMAGLPVKRVLALKDNPNYGYVETEDGEWLDGTLHVHQDGWVSVG